MITVYQKNINVEKLTVKREDNVKQITLCTKDHCTHTEGRDSESGFSYVMASQYDFVIGKCLNKYAIKWLT